MSKDKDSIYSLVKDEIKVLLINRTDEDQVINLFALPSGVNSSQGITYGSLFTTKYCEVLIPISDFSASKSWTLNWLDAEGSPQTDSFASVGISDFIFNLNQSSNDTFSYSEVGSNYKIYKTPIDTFVYFTGWQPPIGIDFDIPNGMTLFTSLGASGKRITETLQSGSYFGSGNGTNKNGFWLGHQSGQITFHTYAAPATVDTTRDTNALYGMANVTDLRYDSGSNQVILFNGQTPNGQVAFVNLDATNTLDTLINLPSDYGRGVGYYWQSERLTISAFQGISVLSILYGIDETKSIVHQGQPLNTSGTTNLALCQLKENMSEDESGNLWIGNANQLTAIAENGVFKFSNGDLSQASDEILYDTINGMPQLIYKPICQYLKGRIFVSGFNGSGTWIDVYDVNTKQLIRSNFYTGRAIRSFSYVERYGDYIAWSDTSSTDILVTDFDGQVVQEESTSGNGHHLYSLQGIGSENYILRLDAASTTLNTYIGAISGSSKSENNGGKEEDFYTKNEFTDVVNNTDSLTYSFACYDVIEGTGISVEDVRGNLTYEELVQGLRNNATPYLFENISIGTQTLQQANMPITKIDRGVSGHTSLLIDNPAISPMQRQFKIQDYPINFLPKTISKLLYKVKANQSASITIEYSKGNLNAIVETIDAYVTNDVPLNVPLKQLVKDITDEQRDYIKEKLIAIAKRRNIENDIKEFSLKLDSILLDEDSINRDLEKLKKSQSEVVEMIKTRDKEYLDSKKSKRNIRQIVEDYISKKKG